VREASNSSRPVADLSLLEGSLCYALHRARLSAMSDLNQLFAKHQITSIEFIIMVIVAGNPGVSQAELAAALEVERPRLVPMLNKLEKRGLAKRTALAADGRVRLIQLTKPGVQLLKVLRKHAEEVNRHHLDSLTAAEAKTIFSSLWKVARNPLGRIGSERSPARNPLPDDL
jgi:DNA-binding MarR family transcriptional regulator